MPVVASQHRRGAPLATHVDYVPNREWPETARVQWGDGRSFAPHGGPEVASPAFFEAFLADAEGVWFRGEAPSGIDRAEAAAHGMYMRFMECGGQHDWVRRYDEESGAATCSCCGATGTKALPVVLQPVPTEGPLTPNDLHKVQLGLLHPDRIGKRGDPDRHAEICEAIRVKAERQGFELPDPEGMSQDDYDHACEVAVGAFWGEHRERYREMADGMPPPPRHKPAFWDPMDVACLDDAARGRFSRSFR